MNSFISHYKICTTIIPLLYLSKLRPERLNDWPKSTQLASALAKKGFMSIPSSSELPLCLDCATTIRYWKSVLFPSPLYPSLFSFLASNHSNYLGFNPLSYLLLGTPVKQRVSMGLKSYRDGLKWCLLFFSPLWPHLHSPKYHNFSNCQDDGFASTFCTFCKFPGANWPLEYQIQATATSSRKAKLQTTFHKWPLRHSCTKMSSNVSLWHFLTWMTGNKQAEVQEMNSYKDRVSTGRWRLSGWEGTCPT